jgi:hypothetical protein
VPTFINCVFVVESTPKKKQKKTNKQRKEHEKMKRKRERKTKDNLILSHVNINFLLIGPYAFTHIHCNLQKNVFLM